MALNHDRKKAPVTTPKETAVEAEPKPLTPTEELFMEALSARIRTGENLWTFDSKFTRTAKQLEARGLVDWKSGIVADTIMVFLTAQGKKEWLSPTHVSPLERKLNEHKEKLASTVAALEELQYAVAAKDATGDRNGKWEIARDWMMKRLWSMPEGQGFGYAELIHDVAETTEVDVQLVKLAFEHLEARGDIISTEKGFVAGRLRPGQEATVPEPVAEESSKEKPKRKPKKAGKGGAKKALKKAERLLAHAKAELKVQKKRAKGKK